MQNVFNLKSPFLDPASGNPLVGGRVFFVEPSNDNQTVLIHIYDKNGTEIQNPQLLNDLGTFDTQPFVDDGLDYKMLVERATGLDDPAWELVYTMDSKSQKLHVEYSGAAVADTITALRTVNPEVGVCVVKGYSDAEDCCPSRIFKWTADFLPENYGTHIHSTLPGFTVEGTWVCEPSGFLDVRWFGINSQRGDGSGNIFDALYRAYQSHPNIPLYFPACEFGYILGSSINLRGLILDKGTNIVPLENTVALGIEWLENRGGKFCAKEENEAESIRVIPKIKGSLKTSWFKGTLAEFLTSDALAGVTEIDFDRTETNQSKGTAQVEISGKVLLNVQNLPDNITWVECLALDDEQTANLEKLNARSKVTIGGFEIKRVSNSLQIIRDNGNDNITNFIRFILATQQTSACVSFPILVKFLSSVIHESTAFFEDSIYIGDGANNAWSSTLLKASRIYSNDVDGKITGKLIPPLVVSVNLTGDGSAGYTRQGSAITINDGEMFLLCVKIDLAKYTTSEAHQYTYLYPINGTSKELVVSNDDISQREGMTLAVGYRNGDEYFFTYNRDEGLFSVNYGIFVRDRQ